MILTGAPYWLLILAPFALIAIWMLNHLDR